MQQFKSILLYLLLIGMLGFAGLRLHAQDQDVILDSLMEAVTPEIIQAIGSPDGQFRAEVIVYPCAEIEGQEYSYERLDLIDNGTAATEMIAEQLISCGGLGAFGLSVMRWTDTYLYYTDSREGVPDGLAIAWTPFVLRANLTTLESERLGTATFSPDGQWLAAWSQGSVRIISSDSEDQSEFSMMPENLQLVQVIWLPDSSGVIYMQTDNLFDSSQSTVTHIDLATMEQTVILETER